jgi:ligand-binding sensor domain-containing protein
MPKLSLSILLLCSILVCFGQSFDEKNFVHYSVENGLSDDYISGLEQDSYGYVWISTYNGLNRFDGSTFKQFQHSTTSTSLPDNKIVSLQQLGSNELGIATEDGVQLLNTRSLKTRNLEIPTSDVLRYWSNSCRYILTDKAGNYGVSTKTGFYIFRKNGRLKNRWDYYTEKDIGQAWMMFGSVLFRLPDGNIMQRNRLGLTIYNEKINRMDDASLHYKSLANLITELKKTPQAFFFVSPRTILLLNNTNNTFQLIDLINGSKRAFTASIKLLEETGWQTRLTHLDDTTWAFNSKRKGFYLLHIDRRFSSVKCDTTNYFPDHYCTILYCDTAKRLWVGTNAGLFMQNTHPSLVKTYPINVEKEHSITSLYVTQSKIYAATDNRELLIIDKLKKTVLRRVQLLSRQDEFVMFTDIQPFSTDTLWLASNKGILWFNTSNYTFGNIQLTRGVINSGINILFKDHNGNVWIGSNKVNVVYLYHKNTGIVDSLTDKNNLLFKINIATSFAEDRYGNTWVGGDAIVRWNAKRQKVDTLIGKLPNQQNVKKGFLVMSDSRGDIWVTVPQDGLAKITGNSPVHARPANLLPDYNLDISSSLLHDRIWIYTNRGPGYFNTRTLQSMQFHPADGLPAIKPTCFHFSSTDDHSIWFACKNILCELPVNSQSMMQPPVLRISELTINNKLDINYPLPEVSFNYNENVVKASLSTINYTDPKNMRFAYHIKGLNSERWTEMGEQQDILLTNISPGEYILEAKVYAYDNKWPEQIKQLSIIIKPPFWKTTIFYILICILTGSIVYTIYRKRLKRIQQKAQLDQLLSQTEMKALMAQMNPHFIFNCLNSIREMILNNENRQASRYLGKFAQLIRITLNQSTKAFVSLKDTTEYLRRYLEMEQIRSDMFSYCIEVDEVLISEDISLPPMLLQPFIENSIWHAAKKDKSTIEIQIQFLQRGQHLVCIIEDDGIGINNCNSGNVVSQQEFSGENEHSSYGIVNVKKRMQVLNEKYRMNSTMKIEDKSTGGEQQETGTKVTLTFPLKLKEYEVADSFSR